jgi:hypothetical protein
MNIDWLIDNSKNSRGFISQRTVFQTYAAICQTFGTAMIKNHGRTEEGISIGQVLSPVDFYKKED